MTRTKAITILLVFVLISAGFADFRVFTLSGGLSNEQNRLAFVQLRLLKVQNQLLVSQKASTSTRVNTVSQRCRLTELILGVLVRVHDITDSAPFQHSLIICQKQLALVKSINAKTPSINKSP